MSADSDVSASLMLAFADFELDMERFELRRAGQKLTVQPLVLELIAYLAKHRRRVVGRDELVREVWRSRVVSDAALARALRKAREVLDDDGERQRILQTVHGRGFRFVADARAPAPTTPEPTHSVPERGSQLEPQAWVGRQSALSKFEELLRRADQGRGATWLVSGEAGIGKTSLLEHCVRIAEAHGAQCYIGRCQNLPGAPACWPWVQITAAIWRTLPDGERGAFMPALSPLLPDNVSEMAFDAPAERFVVFDAMLRLLRQQSQARSVVIVLDDLQHADASSLALAEWLSREARQLRLLLLCSYRQHTSSQATHEPGRMHVAGALLHGATELLELHGLTRSDVAEWIRQQTGAEPNTELTNALQARTAGNPLYVQHLWPVLRDRKAATSASLPDSLREAIIAHVGADGADDRDILGAAAAVGDSFTPARVAAGAAMPIEPVVMALERARQRGLLGHTQIVGALQFTHGLVREALYEKLLPEQRANIHGRIAAVFMQQVSSPSATQSGPQIALVAHHALRAQPALRTGDGIRFGLLAIDEAFRRGAFEESAAHCRATLEAMAACPTPHPQYDAVALRLASALGRSGRLEEATQAFRSATQATLREQTRQRLQHIDIKALHESVQGLDAQLGSVVADMYQRLFSAHPQTRALFRRNPSEVQERMLVETLTSVLDHFEDAPWLTDTLLALGTRHVDYGVSAEMYDWVGEALLGALAHALGDAWTPAVARAWQAAYAAISALMQKGAQLAQKPLPLPVQLQPA